MSFWRIDEMLWILRPCDEAMGLAWDHLEARDSRPEFGRCLIKFECGIQGAAMRPQYGLLWGDETAYNRSLREGYPRCFGKSRRMPSSTNLVRSFINPQHFWVLKFLVFNEHSTMLSTVAWVEGWKNTSKCRRSTTSELVEWPALPSGIRWCRELRSLTGRREDPVFYDVAAAPWIWSLIKDIRS